MDLSKLSKNAIRDIKKYIEMEKKNDYKSTGFWSNRGTLKTNYKQQGIIYDNDTLKNKQMINPLILPKQLYWDELDYTNDKIILEMSIFLNKYYMYEEGDDFSLEYSPSMLKWYLNIPNDNKNICLGLRLKDNNRLVGVISGIFFKGSFYKNMVNVMDVNFFCINPKLRCKGLAEKMIDEITRKCIIENNVYHSVFSCSRKIPNNICELKYYHRPLNFIKLVETNFYDIPNDVCIQSANENFKLHYNSNNNFRKININDIDKIHELLNNYFDNFSIHFIFTKEQIKYLFINDFVDSYVWDSNGEITDFISYYKIKYRTINPNKESNKYINIAQIFYYANFKNTLYTLGKNILIKAKENNMDVFNCLNDMNNNEIIDNLNFTEGTGILRHYLYNWIVNKLEPSDTAKHII